jgi:hypothetical protein
MATPPAGEHGGDEQSTSGPATGPQTHDPPVMERAWYRSPWLLPIAGLGAIVLVDQIGGATAVVRVAAIAVAVCVAVIAAPSLEEPRHSAVFAATVLVAGTATFVVLDQPKVHEALEPSDRAAPRSTRQQPNRFRSLRGMTVRPPQVRARDLRGVDLTAATLDGLDMRYRILNEAHLEGASLAGADLRGAQLQGAHGACQAG